ncbi:MAG: hypothetical protein LBJ67_14670 [Planctomycetaceae bacterium]|nr:hypothetical protein [Planctomycetaceae bacterium]
MRLYLAWAIESSQKLKEQRCFYTAEWNVSIFLPSSSYCKILMYWRSIQDLRHVIVIKLIRCCRRFTWNKRRNLPVRKISTAHQPDGILILLPL